MSTALDDALVADLAGQVFGSLLGPAPPGDPLALDLPPRFEFREGTRVRVAPLRPSDRDRDRVRDGFRRLSPRSRYLRFMTPMIELSASTRRDSTPK